MDRGKHKLSRYCIFNCKVSIYNLSVLALGQNLLNEIQREILKNTVKKSYGIILRNFASYGT